MGQSAGACGGEGDEDSAEFGVEGVRKVYFDTPQTIRMTCVGAMERIVKGLQEQPFPMSGAAFRIAKALGFEVPDPPIFSRRMRGKR